MNISIMGMVGTGCAIAVVALVVGFAVGWFVAILHVQDLRDGQR